MSNQQETIEHTIELTGDRTVTFMKVDKTAMFMRCLPDVWFKYESRGLQLRAVLRPAPLEAAYQQAKTMQERQERGE